jgi:hypothetical protein
VKAWADKIGLIQAIWGGKFPRKRPREHSLIEKLVSTLAIIVCLGSLANFSGLLPKTKSGSRLFMDLYVLIWCAVLAIVLFGSFLPIILCEILAAYRILDIMSYRIFFLMVKSQEEPWRPEILRRSLAIAIVNFTELIFAFAVLYLYCGCIKGGNSTTALSSGADALYYSVVTMTTVGYGDFAPANVNGRMLVTVLRECIPPGFRIDETEGMASSSVYRYRFGSLVQAYKLIEYTPDRDYQFIETNRELRRIYPELVADAVSNIRRLGGAVVADSRTDLLTINREFTASIVLARSRQKLNGCFRWLIRLDTGLKPDITVAVRMDAENRKPIDYYLLPSIDIVFRELTLAEDNPVSLETFRFDTLDFFFGMARRIQIPEAA